jgi:Zn ribbon nucleic-acid-binding protein
MECPACKSEMKFEWNVTDERGCYWQCMGCGYWEKVGDRRRVDRGVKGDQAA